MNSILEQPNYKTVTLKLCDHIICLSESFVKVTILYEYLKADSDIGVLFFEDNKVKDIGLMKHILRFFSDCHELSVEDHVITLCDILLNSSSDNVLLNITISSMNINTFLDLYIALFTFEYHRIIFETYEELMRFVEVVRNWLLQQSDLNKELWSHNTTHNIHTLLEMLNDTLFKFLIIEDELINIRCEIRQYEWVSCLNNMKFSPLIKSAYETMRLN